MTLKETMYIFHYSFLQFQHCHFIYITAKPIKMYKPIKWTFLRCNLYSLQCKGEIGAWNMSKSHLLYIICSCIPTRIFDGFKCKYLEVSVWRLTNKSKAAINCYLWMTTFLVFYLNQHQNSLTRTSKFNDQH